MRCPWSCSPQRSRYRRCCGCRSATTRGHGGQAWPTPTGIVCRAGQRGDALVGEGVAAPTGNLAVYSPSTAPAGGLMRSPMTYRLVPSTAGAAIQK